LFRALRKVALLALGVAPAAFCSLVTASATWARPDPQWDALRDQAISDRAALLAVLDSLDARYERVCVRLGETNWALYSTGESEDREGAKGELVTLLTDERTKKLVSTWLPQTASPEDSTLNRRLTLWRNAEAGADVEYNPRIASLVEKLQPQIIAYRAKVGGKELSRGDVNHVLDTERDRGKRREAYESYVPLAKRIEKDIIQLVRLRNAKAKDLGYKSYAHMMLSLSGVDHDWLMGVMQKVQDGTNSVYFQWLDNAKRTFSIDEPMAWDLRYLVNQTASVPDRFFPQDKAVERLSATLTAMGYDIDKMPIRVEQAAIPFGGFNVAVRIPTDDRLLVNPSGGQRFYQTLFHEYGHGLETVLNKQASAILKGYEWAPGASTPSLSEGMGQAMAEWTNDPAWLRAVAALPADEVKRDLPLIRNARAVRLRSILVDVMTELKLYEAPAGDISGFERRMRKEILGVDTPAASQSWWAASAFLLDYPIYQHNYILADIIGWQVHDALATQFGEKAHANPGVAAFMQDQFFGPSESLDWQTKMRRATGKDLDVDGFVAEFLRP
jgi:peptidyl-dipeptidase A